MMNFFQHLPFIELGSAVIAGTRGTRERTQQASPFMSLYHAGVLVDSTQLAIPFMTTNPHAREAPCWSSLMPL